MADIALKPVEESISKARGEIDVGEDLAFQRKWWRFERIAWALFAFIVLLDLLGVFGRGPLARAERATPDGALSVQYERVERKGAPSILTMRFGERAIDRGKIHLFVTDSLVHELGGQRVIPQPEVTSTGGGGLTYDFAATTAPALVQFALQPQAAGVFSLCVAVVGSPRLDLRIAVVP